MRSRASRLESDPHAERSRRDPAWRRMWESHDLSAKRRRLEAAFPGGTALVLMVLCSSSPGARVLRRRMALHAAHLGDVPVLPPPVLSGSHSHTRLPHFSSLGRITFWLELCQAAYGESPAPIPSQVLYPARQQCSMPSLHALLRCSLLAISISSIEMHPCCAGLRLRARMPGTVLSRHAPHMHGRSAMIEGGLSHDGRALRTEQAQLLTVASRTAELMSGSRVLEFPSNACQYRPR
ncbi:hypothetical protein BC628DRAFT_457773 [Trametes gibbosa]|nr:hypothetical protein BC628DRAFT_457773 [Trametes gibbosa]